MKTLKDVHDPAQLAAILPQLVELGITIGFSPEEKDELLIRINQTRTRLTDEIEGTRKLLITLDQIQERLLNLK